MVFEADVLTAADDADYAGLLASCSGAMVYGSLEYRDFLRAVLPGAEDRYLGVRRNGRMVGALPLFVCRDGSLTAIGSLPYFGSHGDVIVADDADDPAAIEAALLGGLRELAAETGAEAVTVIESPVRREQAERTGMDFLARVDDRIGQITVLPAAGTRQDALEAVLRLCRQKTRNLVRKGLRSAFEIELSEADGDWRDLYGHHVAGMARIGGRAKDRSALAALRRAFAKGGCRLYVARRGGRFAGGLLLLQYKDWVEYFMPVAAEEFRSEQVLSALIAHAMADAILAGRRYWNWGGTWRSQEGVYHFKNGWGARDFVYGYFCAPLGPRLQRMAPDEILSHFPYCYIKPFGSAPVPRPKAVSDTGSAPELGLVGG